MNDPELKRTQVAFIQLTSFPGWKYLEQYALGTIRQMESTAVEEDDPVKRESLIHDARGAKKFWKILIGALEHTKAAEMEPTEDPADDFLAIIDKKPEATQ